ncbi:MAG: class I tRNA ligase family protein, partial [Parvibaculales bacterium]
EYEEHVSPTIFVKFPVQGMDNTYAVIWTTTPWTIPGNRAMAYSAGLTYGLYAANGEQLVLCDNLAAQVMQAAQIEDFERRGDINPGELVCHHPFHGQGYDFDVPVLAGDFVTDETGTGLVHIAPGHGQDDFELGMQHNIEVPFTVDEGGVYLDSVPVFAGKRVLDEKGKDGDANGAVIGALVEADRLLTKGKLRHQYPHSWRSKAPLIFRNTPQWFISMETNGLRDTALQEIDKVNWYPPSGRNRIFSMIENRPDWVVSRQRAWGVPLTIFVDKKTGEPLRDDAVNARIVDAVKAKGADAWFDTDPQDFLGADYQIEDYDQVSDILDVWFDSGVTHAFVMEARDDLAWPADVYLEGSDQHRGWFHSSLLEACATRGAAPYKNVITHGMTMTEQGKKMSKSLGNIMVMDDLLAHAPGEAVRLALLQGQYRQRLDFTPDLLTQSKKNLDRLYGALRDAADIEAAETDAPEGFMAALCDDLNTPKALAELFALAKRADTPDGKGALLAAGKLMGLLEQNPEEWFAAQTADADIDAAAVEGLIAERTQARADKDYAAADAARDKLTAMGVTIEDTADGTIWKPAK